MLKAKIIFCVSMFYDLNDPGQFLEAVKLALHPEGIFIVQMNYLGTMLQNLAVDNICQEHVCYYSAASFEKLVQAHGLKITGIEQTPVNGGSIRFYLTHGEGTKPTVQEFIDRELRQMGATPWQEFTRRLEAAKSSILRYLSSQSEQGAALGLCGASTRGLVTLHYLGLDHKTFSCASERDELKWGKYYGSTGIPIVCEEEARCHCNILMVLPWHFADEIISREREFLKSGGELIFPFPAPRVVRNMGSEWIR